MSDEPASRPLRKDAVRNRALLVQAGREVFAERGLEASLDDVARHAGLGVGTAYRHFANKYDLARAIFTDAIDQLVAKADAAAELRDPWDGLVAFLEAVAEAQTADRGLREVMMGAHDANDMKQVNERIAASLAATLDRAKEAGEVREDLELSDIGAVVLMLCTVADVTGDLAPELWRRYLPMLLDALRGAAPLPVAALGQDEFFQALSSHKLRMARVAEQAPPAAASG
jgi:AcrR family transcriptional regulator